MAVVISGTVAPLAGGAEEETFAGRVWIGDDGRVDAVTAGRRAGPAGFANATAVDVGDALVLPGFVDLHSHLGYNFLPLWADPAEAKPYLHHDIWPGRQSYKPGISWPAWTLMDQAPETLFAYLQVRAVAGGTTTIQGWPSRSRPPANRLVRCADDDQVGPLDDPVSVSTLTLEPPDLHKRADILASGRSFIYHCGEGQLGSKAGAEFDDLSGPGWSCLKSGFIAIHACALEPEDFTEWKRVAKPKRGETAGTVVWSPFSNLWLYGITTLIPDVRAAGLGVCLGTDWGPSGTKNLLGEIKVARLWSDHQGWGLTDADLVRMITCTPGDALSRAWKAPVGRLVPGALADVTVLARRQGNDVWHDVVSARDADVSLVLMDGVPRFGTAALMQAAGAAHTTAVGIGPASRRVSLVRPDDPTATWTWTDVRRRLDAVRAAAKAEPPAGPAGARGGQARTVAPGAGDPAGTPPIAVRLDMPGGPAVTAGPPPKGQTIDMAPIEPLHHDRSWLASIRGRGFHGGALDGLGSFYR